MSDLEEVKALDSAIANGINTKDAASIAAVYTDNASIMPPGAPLIEGKTAIQAYWQAGIDGGFTDVSIVPTTIDINGESSVTVGTVNGKAGDVTLIGKYIVIGQKTSEGWRVHYDIWNFDA